LTPSASPVVGRDYLAFHVDPVLLLAFGHLQNSLRRVGNHFRILREVLRSWQGTRPEPLSTELNLLTRAVFVNDFGALSSPLSLQSV